MYKYLYYYAGMDKLRLYRAKVIRETRCFYFTKAGVGEQKISKE